MNTCKNCKFFELNSQRFRNEKGYYPETGWCRRHAPHPKLYRDSEDPDGVVIVEWPFVEGEDWCGEHISAASK